MSRIRYHAPDTMLIGVAALLTGIGLIVLYSAGAVVGYQKFGQADYFLIRQLFYCIVGIGCMVVTALVDYHVYKKYAVPMLVGSIILLVAVFTDLGVGAGGAHRWIGIGSFQLQPSEIVKLTFLFYLAVWLEKRQTRLQDYSYGLLPFIVLLGTIAGLILLQPDLGSLTIIVCISVIVYFVAGAPLLHLAMLLLGGTGAMAIAVQLAPYRLERLTTFLQLNVDPKGAGYHITQALIAIGSGGLFGRGLGHSLQKFNVLPEVTSDSIFAVMAEELGFFLVVGVIALFGIFLWRGVSIARNAPDMFGRLIAIGVAAGVMVQALVNIGAQTAILPLTGITLPFISSGGSSLVITLASVGVLINISRQGRK